MDPSSQDFREYLKKCNRKSLLRLRWLIYAHKLDQAIPEIGPITGIITVGELILWICLPPEFQSAWSMFFSVWAAALLFCVGIISVPRRYAAYHAHWVNGD